MRAKIKIKLPEFSQCLIAFSTATICSSTKNSKEFNRLDLLKPQKHLTRSMSLPRAHCALIKVQQLNLLFKYKICNSKPHWNYRNSEIQERSAWKFSENKQSWLGPATYPHYCRLLIIIQLNLIAEPNPTHSIEFNAIFRLSLIVIGKHANLKKNFNFVAYWKNSKIIISNFNGISFAQSMHFSPFSLKMLAGEKSLGW